MSYFLIDNYNKISTKFKIIFIRNFTSIMFRKILIANRGEIAVRIIRSCEEMGIQTVAIYSEADRLAPHVLKATEAYCVGPAPSSDSYLNTEKIISIIKEKKVDAVHPGYGFLSENCTFSKDVMNAGATWIGPSTEAITTLSLIHI